MKPEGRLVITEWSDMHYEVYIDILFFTNFMMDSLILMTVRNILKSKTPVWQVFFGGAVGAALTCMVFLLPLQGIVKIVLSLSGISTVMLFAGLGIRTWRDWKRAMGVLFVSAFLLGGILQIFQPYVRTGSLFFSVAVVSYLILGGCWKLLTRIRNHQKKICEVILFSDGKSETIRALIDTGNGLTDPVSKEPVHVVDMKTVKQLGIRTLYGLRYIPYRTVNGTGIMPVVRVEKMYVKGEQECMVKRPILGICEEMISEKEEYQMILNADIL